jgi:hypothetical protein
VTVIAIPCTCGGNGLCVACILGEYEPSFPAPVAPEPAPEPVLDECELRASLQSAIDGALVVADRLAEHVTTHSFDPYAVALAASYNDMRRLVRRLRRALAVEIAG